MQPSPNSASKPSHVRIMILIVSLPIHPSVERTIHHPNVKLPFLVPTLKPAVSTRKRNPVTQISATGLIQLSALTSKPILIVKPIAIPKLTAKP
jgi:hypothetical protein